MNNIGKSHLAGIMPYKPGKPIEEVKRELGLKEVIKLASNENPLSPPKGVLKAILKAAKEINRYPDGSCFGVRKALAKKFKVSNDEIVFGNGSDEIIVMAVRAFAEEGDEVLFTSPTFTVYGITSRVEGVTVREVPRSDNFEYDMKALAGAINEKTRIVFIANPDNPTGTYVNKKAFDAFIEKVPSNVVVFMDEAYYEFAKGADYPETLDQIKRTDKNVIVARTFSKVYGMAGLRIGYAFARPDIIDTINKVREPFNINSLAQAAAVAALNEKKYLAASVKLVKDEKNRYYKYFKKAGIEYVPSKTNFILFNTERDSKKVFDSLLGKGIITREMSVWGLPGYIRVNIGLKKENDKFFKAFDAVLANIPKN